jgi:spermidine synthase
MKKWTLLDQAATPDGGTISLHEHDGRYVIRVNGAELMSTRQHASEERLAELACEPLRAKRVPRVLIGGLGFGYTLKAALAVLPPDAKVVVAELMEAVITWNRNPAYPLAAAALADPRVRVVNQDVGELILRDGSGFDAIILDVDNGPAAMTTSGNKRLYQEEGLMRLQAALRPDGIVAFWSATEDPRFEKLMSKAGFAVDVQKARAHPTSGAWHSLFLGRIR